MKATALAVIVVGAVGCFTPMPALKLPARPMLVFPTAHVEGVAADVQIRAAEVRAAVDQDITKMYDRCSTKRDSLQDEVNGAHDKESKWKTGLGAVGGGLTAIFGVLGGATAANESVTAPAGMTTFSHTNNISLASGITTAVLGAVTTIAVVFATPGKETIQQADTRQKAISAELKKLTDFLTAHGGDPATWDGPTKGQWDALVLEVGGYCPP